ncbi:MAG: FAD-binding oxidoreductase [Dermatophilaceae bacterium]
MSRTFNAPPPLIAGSENHVSALRAWNLMTRHAPAAAFAATRTDDVVAAVRYARHRGLGVAPTATGHGIPAVGDDGVLVSTAGMRRVDIDPGRRTARIGAGARWADLHSASAPHGLVGVAGSSSQVGVVGFTQGGGFGWLSRRLGFASSSVRAAELVTADGSVHEVDDLHNPDVRWGVAGGAGNLGVVTRLTIDLHRVGEPGAAGPTTVHGGNLYYPVERAAEVAIFYAGWAPRLPREVMSALTFRWFPPASAVPTPLRGRTFVAIRACASGLSWIGEELVQLARTALGAPVADTFTALPAHDLDAISADPTTPVPAIQRGETLRELDEDAITVLAEEAQPADGPPLVMVELRQLGGAMDDAPRGPHPMARTRGAYSVNAVSLVPNAEAQAPARARQNRLFDRLRPHLTGDTYLNFLDGGGATPQRVRAAYDDADWARLVDLKAALDPDNTFRFGRTIHPTPPNPSPNGEPS